MRIQNNIMAMNAHRSLGNNNNATAKSLEKLSSGYRINRAGDDAAGLAISEKMRAQIKGLETAQKNANDGISLVQTAEGALTEVHSMLNRMSELATQSANGTYQNEVDREALQSEVNSLRSEIDRISSSTNFNGIKLLDGSLSVPKSEFNAGSAAVTGVTATVSGTTGITINAGTGDKFNGLQIEVIQGAGAADGAASYANGKLTITMQGTGTALDQNMIDGAMGAWATATGKTYAAGDIGIGTPVVGSGTVSGGVTAAPAKNATQDITFSKSSQYGSTITVDGTNYEIVKDAADVTAGNTALVVADLNASTIAQAFADAYVGTGATANGDKVTIDLGSDTATELAVSSKGFGLGLQVGDTAEAFQKVNVSVGDMSKVGLGIDTLDIGTQAGAAAAMDAIKNAINTVSSNRADLGAVQNRLEHTVNNLGVQTENIQAAESRIRDVDMAKEMMTFTKSNILTQAAQAMLAQANQQPQGVLQLLR